MTSKETRRNILFGKAVPAALAALTCFALPYIAPMSNTLDYTNSIWPVFVFAGAWWFFAVFLKKDFSKQRRYSLPPAIILSFLLVVGKYIYIYIYSAGAGHDAISAAALSLPVSLALLCLILYLLISQLWLSLEGLGEAPAVGRSSLGGRFFGLPYWPLVMAAAFMLVWLPVWLGSWPGTFYGDISQQTLQFATRYFNGNFPLMHTLIMGGTVCVVQSLTGSLSAGVAVYVGLQMIYLASVFTYSIVFLRRRGCPPAVMLAAWLLYALSPVILLFCKDAVRDVLFSTTALLFGVLLSEFLLSPESFFRSGLRVAALIISGFMTMSLRNAAPALIVCLALLLCARALVLRKSFLGKMLLIFTAVIGLFTIWRVSSHSLLNVERQAESKEMLSVPIQQISCIACYAEEDLTPIDRQMINELFQYTDSPRELFDYDNADYAKACFRNDVFSASPAKYSAWWLSLCSRFPKLAVGSFLRLNLEAWYPNTVFASYCTPPHEAFTMFDAVYYMPDGDHFGTADSRLPWLYDLQLRLSYGISFSKIPLVSMAFSPAFALYVLVLCAFYLKYRRRSAAAMPVVIALLVQFSTVFGPTVVLRYYLLTFMTVPYAVALMLSPPPAAPSAAGSL